VVCIHLHADHVGWNTQNLTGEWVPTFPNATYLFPKADFDYWNPEGGNQPRGGLMNADVFADSVLPVVRAGQAEFFTGQHVIDVNLMIAPAPGHSPGAAVVELDSRGERALFAGDLLHTPMQILHPEQGACFDEDRAGAAETRERILRQAADSRAAFMPAHFGVEWAARVVQRGNSYAIDSRMAFE